MLIADDNGESDDFVSDLPYAFPLFHLSDGKAQGGRELVGLDICHLLRMLGQCLVKLPDNMETFHESTSRRGMRPPPTYYCPNIDLENWENAVNRSDGYPLG